MKFVAPAFPRITFAPHLGFARSATPSHFVYSWRCRLLSPLRSTLQFRLCVPGRGTLRLVTSRPHLSPRCRKSSGRRCSGRSFLAFGSTPQSSSPVSSHCSVTATLRSLSWYLTTRWLLSPTRRPRSDPRLHSSIV